MPTIVKKISSFSFPLQNTAWQGLSLPYLNAFSLESALERESSRTMNATHLCIHVRINAHAHFYTNILHILVNL